MKAFIRIRRGRLTFLPFVIIAIFTNWGCAQVDKAGKIQFYEDTLQMKKELLKFIPVGTEIERATEIIKQNKIDCEIHEDSDFWDGTITRENIDYLYCDHEVAAGLLMAKRWQFAIVYVDGKVVEILVSYGLTGP